MANQTNQDNIKEEKKFKGHSGHRQRMKKKYLISGLDFFEPHEILEMLLFYAVPMKNTSLLAHNLIDEFGGSISAVFDAPIDALIKFGLTEHQATLLKMIPDLARIYLDDKHNNPNKVINPDTVGEYIVRKFVGIENEEVLLLLTDAKLKEVFCGIVSKGSLVQSEIPIRRIVDFAMRYNARGAIIAHNHPSGIALPSADDYKATKNIKNALSLIGVALFDHFIVADNDCISMAQSRLAPDIFEVPDEF